MHLNIVYRSGRSEEIVNVAKLRVGPEELELFTYNHLHEVLSLADLKEFELTYIHILE